MLIDSKRIQATSLVCAAVLLVAPLLFQGFFGRLKSEQVAEGFSYRKDIYTASVNDIQASNYVTGYGASGVPETINSRNKAPDGVVESLDQGFVFLSAHDIFLDIALSFGLISGLAFLFLTIQALRELLLTLFDPMNLALNLTFLLALLNGIFNVPSIEMTLLLIATLVALLPLRKLKTR